MKPPFAVDNFDEICDQLRQLFVQSELSMAELARRSGITKTEIGWFVGTSAHRSRLGSAKIDQIAKALGSELRATEPNYDLLGYPSDPVVEINELFVRCRVPEMTYDDVRLFSTHYSYYFGPHIELEREGAWLPFKPGDKVTVVEGLRFRMYPWLLAGTGRGRVGEWRSAEPIVSAELALAAGSVNPGHFETR